MSLSWSPWDQPSVPVLLPDGSHTKLSILDVLRRADEITDLCGETPGETVVLLEWLIALAYASGEYPRTDGDWVDRITSRTSLDPVVTWVEEQNFPGLFDRDRPLGQDVRLREHLDTYGVGPAQLVLEHAGDYNQFADSHHLYSGPVPADKAWRAMLTHHAYGIGIRGRIKAKAMGLYPAYTNLGTSRLAARVRVMVRPSGPGSTLSDVIRMNTFPWKGSPGHMNLTWCQEGVRRRDFSAPGPRQTRLPSGPADLYSVLGRSVILRPVEMADGSVGVDRVLVGAGETLSELPRAQVPDVVGKPLRPSVVRPVWREVHALYGAFAESDEDSLYRRIALLGRDVSLWTSGLATDTGKFLGWSTSSFPCPVGRAEVLHEAARRGVEICEYAASGLYSAAVTARSYAYPAGSPDDKARQVARFDGRRSFWEEASELFQILLSETADSPEEALENFGRSIRESAVACLEDRLRSVPSTAAGFRVRAFAQDKLRVILLLEKAPDFLREEGS